MSADHNVDNDEKVGVSATETKQIYIQIDFRQNLVKCFYSEQKATKIEISLTYKEINNTDNAVQT